MKVQDVYFVVKDPKVFLVITVFILVQSCGQLN